MISLIRTYFKYNQIVKLFPSEQILYFFCMIQGCLIKFIFFTKGNLLIKSNHLRSIRKLILTFLIFHDLLFISILVFKILRVFFLGNLLSFVDYLLSSFLEFKFIFLTMIQEVFKLFLIKHFISVTNVGVFKILGLL